MSADPERQRAFYETRAHQHLQPAERGDFYAAKLVRELAAATAIAPTDRVLEVGAGFGRFTFALREHCRSVLALDLSSRALATLEATRAARAIPVESCRTLCCDVAALLPEQIGERFDRVVGFFILHHLPDATDAIRRLAPLVAPGGTIAFLEPNRRNPLFLAQVACCPDMTWAEEKGMFRLRARTIEAAFAAAGLAVQPTRRFGCFPPQLVNRFALARRVEAAVERSRVLEPLLPFQILRARR